MFTSRPPHVFKTTYERDTNKGVKEEIRVGIQGGEKGDKKVYERGLRVYEMVVVDITSPSHPGHYRWSLVVFTLPF